MPLGAAPHMSDPQVYSLPEQLMLTMLVFLVTRHLLRIVFCPEVSMFFTFSAGFGSMPAVSEEGSSGSGVRPEAVHVDIGSLQHYKNRVGPELRLMRQAQGRNRYCAHLSTYTTPQKLLCLFAKWLACLLHAAQTYPTIIFSSGSNQLPLLVTVLLCIVLPSTQAFRHAGSLLYPVMSHCILSMFTLPSVEASESKSQTVTSAGSTTL